MYCKVGTQEGTSPWDKSNGVNWSFLLKNLDAVTNFGPCDWSHKFKPV